MKTLITLCSLVAALGFGWQYNVASTGLGDVQRELSETRGQLAAANSRLAQLSAQLSGPTPKTSWTQERIQNWHSSLSDAASGNRTVVKVAPPIYYPVPPNTTYSTDSKGRYWTDQNGVKHYVP